MKKFRIVISDSDVLLSEDNLHRGQARDMDAVIYLKIGEESYFPCRDWTDFTSSVLFQWIENVLRNRGRNGAGYELWFMDGPYKVNVFQDNGEMTLTGICFRHGDETLFQLTCRYEELLEELLHAVKRLAYILKTNPALDRRYDDVAEAARYYERKLRDALPEGEGENG